MSAMRRDDVSAGFGMVWYEQMVDFPIQEVYYKAGMRVKISDQAPEAGLDSNRIQSRLAWGGCCGYRSEHDAT